MNRFAIHIAAAIILCCSSVTYAQVHDYNEPEDTFYSDEYSVESAKKALGEGTASLIIVGGISPTVYVGQERFKKKYGVDYYDFGCTPECSDQQMKLYNYTIFNWLEGRFGNKWQKDVRKDVVGLEKWALYQNAIPYLLVDSKPTFNGGTDMDFSLWVINHMSVREQDKIPGRVVLNILLSEDGTIMDIDNLGVQDYSPLTQAYIKAAMAAPHWTPASHEGKPCKVKISISSSIDYR